MSSHLKDFARLVGQPREVRLKPADERSIVRDLDSHELRGATDIVSRAANTIAEMHKRNQDVAAAATRAVQYYKAEAEAASMQAESLVRRNAELTESRAALSERVAELNERVEQLEAALEEQALEFQDRVDELQMRLTMALSIIDEKTAVAETAQEWLDHLASEIKRHLAEEPPMIEMPHELQNKRFEPFAD